MDVSFRRPIRGGLFSGVDTGGVAPGYIPPSLRLDEHFSPAFAFLPPRCYPLAHEIPRRGSCGRARLCGPRDGSADLARADLGRGHGGLGVGEGEAAAHRRERAAGGEHERGVAGAAVVRPGHGHGCLGRDGGLPRHGAEAGHAILLRAGGGRDAPLDAARGVQNFPSDECAGVVQLRLRFVREDGFGESGV